SGRPACRQRLRHRHLARSDFEDLRAVLPGRFVVDARVRRHRPGPDAREGIRRGARRAHLGRHRARPGLDIRRDVPAARRGGPVTWLGELSFAVPLAVLCVFVSGFCSGTEVALFSLRRVDREQLARSELRIDRRILKLLERPRRLIATVLIGNETFNSLLAVLALVVVSKLDGPRSPWLWGLIALGVSLPLIVLVSEVTSKTLAAKAPLLWSRVRVLPLSG